MGKRISRQFVEDVLAKVSCTPFLSPYLATSGGDEVPRDPGKACPDCQRESSRRYSLKDTEQESAEDLLAGASSTKRGSYLKSLEKNDWWTKSSPTNIDPKP